MQWSPDRNAGFSRVNPQRLYLPVIIDSEYHYESVNVENQISNTTSLLWWMRRVIAMRKRLKPLGNGALEMLLPDNPKVLAFLRSHGDEVLLVVVNLSRFAQVARLDLSRYAGLAPEEVFSHNIYPVIRKEPYILTLGVHDYYWFLLRSTREQMIESELPRLSLKSGVPWESVLLGKAGERFVDLLAEYLPRCRWFRSKARLVSQVELVDRLPVGAGARTSRLVLLKVSYTEGLAETYLLPLAWLPREQAERLLEDLPGARIAILNLGDQEGMLFDGVHDENFRDNLLQMIARRRKVKGDRGELVATPGRRFRELRGGAGTALSSRVAKTEQSNSSVQYGDRFFLKLYRQPDTGINPDPEITRFLTEKARFSRIPPFAGLLEYTLPGKDPMTIGLLQGYVPNQGDAWGFTLDVLSRYIERVLTHHHEIPSAPKPCPTLFDCDFAELPEKMHELIGTFYLEMAALLGRRTAETHQALAVNTADPAWRPEEFSVLYQRSVYQSMRSLCRRVFQSLAQNLGRLTERNRAAAERVLAAEKEILLRFGRIRERKLSASKIRIHGDYHLGQVLFTGKDFIIIDFEGEPARTLSERRLKRSPLRDVAGMIRSFHYASFMALHKHVRNHSDDQSVLEPWLETWYTYAGGTFLSAYRQQLGESRLLPAENGDVELMLDAFLLEKAVYELGYELNNRPDWVEIPLRGIEIILGASTDAPEK
jgi:maltose alpha-D-glucosyltransferase/alpha-amylase